MTGNKNVILTTTILLNILENPCHSFSRIFDVSRILCFRTQTVIHRHYCKPLFSQFFGNKFISTFHTTTVKPDDSVAAYLPVSGQTVTHFTIRKERGLPDGIPVVDEYAPVNKARKETAPLVLITGDKHLEMAARYEENALLEAVLKSIGNKKVTLYEMQGFDHGQVLGPACYLIADYVKRFK